MKWYYWGIAAAVLIVGIVWYLYYGGKDWISNTFGALGSTS
jgi:hypothetical protein